MRLLMMMMPLKQLTTPGSWLLPLLVSPENSTVYHMLALVVFMFMLSEPIMLFLPMQLLVFETI